MTQASDHPAADADADVPGVGHLGGRVAAFDARADELLEPLRTNPATAKVFHLASEYGDFSAIWHTVGLLRATAGPASRRQSLALSALLGVESLVVNQGVKRLFRRTRPTTTGDDRFAVRRPSTSSFPSGHASSAFFAATLLTTWGGARSAPLWYGLATVIGTSRAVVRIHHASDVVAGAALGVTLGVLARPVARRLG